MRAPLLAHAAYLYPEVRAGDAGRPVLANEFALITRAITLRTGAETAVLAVRDEADRLVHLLSTWGEARDGRVPARSRVPGGGFVGRLLESGRAAAETIDQEHDRSLGLPASGARVTYAAGAAVRPPGGPPGALCLGFSSRPADMVLTLWQLEGYARLAALCLHETGALDGLLSAARLDGLTGCLNYAAVRTELDREIQRARRYGRTVSCCFIDLDHFKAVNDRDGHLYGNSVLAEVAGALQQGIRAGDTIGRYGGDEFLAILPDAGEEEACALGERLRLNIFTTRPSGRDERLDASIGVAEWRPGSTADEMLGAADAALLRAKDGGGGLVVGAGDVTAVARRDAVRGPAAAR